MEEEELLEDLQTMYIFDRRFEFSDSHKKFLKEKVDTTEKMNIYLNLIAQMDLDNQPKNIDEINYQLINKYCMEFDDKNQKITSLCPAVRLFLKEFLIIKSKKNKNELIKTLILFLKSNQNGELFQKLCDQFLIDKRLKKLQLTSNHENEKKEISYSCDPKIIYIVYNLKEMFDFIYDLSFTIAEQLNILIIIQDFQFDLIDYIYIDGKSKYI